VVCKDEKVLSSITAFIFSKESGLGGSSKLCSSLLLFFKDIDSSILFCVDDGRVFVVCV